MSTSCEEVQALLGVYVVGAIDPAERSLVDAHLRTCQECRDQLVRLAGLPALLGRVSEEQIVQMTRTPRAVEEPPEELLESLLARAAEERPGRFRRWAPPFAAAAAAAAIVAALFLSVGDDGKPAPPLPAPSGAAQQILAKDPETHVSVKVFVTPKAWGTAVTLQLLGAPYDATCQLYAVSRDGRHDIAGSWALKEGMGQVEFQGSTSISRTDLVAFELVTTKGHKLVSIPA